MNAPSSPSTTTEVLLRHARLAAMKRSGQGADRWYYPATCHASKNEIELHERHGRSPKNVGKVIFDTKDAADAAARELGVIHGVRFDTFRCERSRHGHQHLRTVR